MSAKQKIGATKFTNILAQWDKGRKYFEIYLI